MEIFFNSLLDWIYKKKCYFCKSSKESVKMCVSCFDELEHLSISPNRAFDGVEIYAAGMYETNLQKLIRGLKYHNQKDLAYFQAKFMYEYWIKIPEKKDSYQIVPVPLYKTREKNRKYNHMALVAQEFSKLSGYEVNLELVKRIKDTKPQYRLNRTQRMENLSAAFEIDKLALKNSGKNPNILIIDDICTTGSTFESIIKELKQNGIDSIVCFSTTTVSE